MKKGSAESKKICIVGAGAAGVAAAWSLSRHPDKFEVEVWEKAQQAGGVATSERIGDQFINDGVQGGAESYRNTLLLHKQFGFKPHPVEMKISFGKGKTAWNNYGKEMETPLVKRLQSEIKRFGKLLWWINLLEVIFIFLPIWLVLKVFRFSQEFSNYMVYPLTALFFGTGNQTPNVSAAVIARVFLDPDLRLFDYDSQLLLSQCPAMFAFTELGTIYSTITKELEEKDEGRVKFFFGRELRRVIKGKTGVTLLDVDGNMEVFDEVIFACDAETALRVIDKPSLMERFTLGNVRYYNDITITHEDEEYMKRHYEIDERRKDQYLIRIDETDPSKVDMSFILSNYQPQLKSSDRVVYQTIFLNDKDASSWNIGQINEDKVLLRKWWRQFAHTWKHFAFVVPFVRFIQGRNHLWYCGAYTLFNTHEIATISGLAAAYRLGADYPFGDEPLAAKQFKMYLKFIHGVSK